MHEKILKLAEQRASECSNGLLTLYQLGPTDQEGCWLAAEDEYIFLAGIQAERDQEAAEYHRAKRRGEDV